MAFVKDIVDWAINFCKPIAKKPFTPDKIKEFEKKFLDLMNLKHRKTLDTIKKGKLTDDVLSTLESVAADLKSSYE